MGKCGAALGMSMSLSMLTLNEVMVVFEVVVVVVVGQVLWRGCSVAVLFDGSCLFVYPIHSFFRPLKGLFWLVGGHKSLPRSVGLIKEKRQKSM